MRRSLSVVVLLLVAGCNRQETAAKVTTESKPQIRAEIVPDEAKIKPAPAIVRGQEAEGWGALKGRIIWGGAKFPEREEVTVTVDKQHCLDVNLNPTANPAKGTILNERILINRQNQGFKNVFVYILVEKGNKIRIHPNLQKFPAEVVIDQPVCMFWPRSLAMREGQVFVVKNSSPVQHNIRWLPDVNSETQGGSEIIKPGGQLAIKNIHAQRLPMPLECNIHGWMKGRLGVFEHPYFAITDEDGKFEIRDAPVGAHKLMIYHEEIGYRLGAKGKYGETVTIRANDVTDLGNVPLGK